MITFHALIILFFLFFEQEQKKNIKSLNSFNVTCGVEGMVKQNQYMNKCV